MISAGSVVEVDTEAAEARTVTVHGTLMASRTAPSRLSLFGNLIVTDQGILDYGTPAERVLVSATIRWFLNEALYVGGMTMEPIATDIGLWGMGNAQVWIHGRYRDTWTALLETAPAGAIIIRVDPTYTGGWQAGDEIVLGPTNPRNSAQDSPNQDEKRRIAEVLGQGRFRLDVPLQHAHEVLSLQWTDSWGDQWIETLSGKVANLTSNIRFEAADPDHRPQVMFMEQAKHFVEDLAVANFSPIPTVSPMGRYAWHNHIQENGSRGSYLRRVRFFGGPGDGIHIHESWGVTMEDVVIYDHSHSRTRDASGRLVAAASAPFMLERTQPGRFPNQHRAADDCWIDRLLVMKWGVPSDVFFSHGIWTTGSVNCVLVGANAAGGSASSRSSGVHWEEGGSAGETSEAAHVYRAEVNSTWQMGFHSWQNATPRERVIDLLAWRNGTGVGWGAYGTNYWGHQIRSVENLVQFGHWAAGWGVTGFLADGRGRLGSIGIEVRRYGNSSTADSVYEDGVVRNVTVNVRHEPLADPSTNHIWVQLARIVWQTGAGVRFENRSHVPFGSRLRFRVQQALNRVANFTLYRRDDPNAPREAVLDEEYNALRVDNDVEGTRSRPPRVRLVTPSDDVVANGSVTLVAESDASVVEFYQANHLLARAPVINGRATFTFNMSQHPNRRGYFWAEAERDGVVNVSRVIRVRKF